MLLLKRREQAGSSGALPRWGRVRPPCEEKWNCWLKWGWRVLVEQLNEITMPHTDLAKHLNPLPVAFPCKERTVRTGGYLSGQDIQTDFRIDEYPEH